MDISQKRIFEWPINTETKGNAKIISNAAQETHSTPAKTRKVCGVWWVQRPGNPQTAGRATHGHLRSCGALSRSCAPCPQVYTRCRNEDTCSPKDAYCNRMLTAALFYSEQPKAENPFKCLPISQWTHCDTVTKRKHYTSVRTTYYTTQQYGEKISQT